MLVLTRWFFLGLLLILQTVGYANADQRLIQPGDPLPELRLFTPTDAADREYLNLPAERTFSPSQIKADLLLIELLNVYCPHCQSQAPAYNELFKLIEENPETQGKIKMLGLAVGNLDWEVKDFRKTYRIKFPILADTSFAAWRAIGGRATPLTIYVRQDQTGQTGVVTGIHQGLNPNYQQLYASLIAMAATDPAELRQKAQEIAEIQAGIKPILSEEEMEFKVRTAFTRFGLIEDFSKLSLLSGRQVYTALIRREQTRERLFAEVTSRRAVCDVCHDVHFIYLFDRTTRIIGFESLLLTKYDNVDWNEREVETMRKNVVGQYLTMPQPFDPKLDAITTATMTSAIIFDSLAQGEELIEELQAQGLM